MIGWRHLGHFIEVLFRLILPISFGIPCSLVHTHIGAKADISQLLFQVFAADVRLESTPAELLRGFTRSPSKLVISLLLICELLFGLLQLLLTPCLAMFPVLIRNRFLHILGVLLIQPLFILLLSQELACELVFISGSDMHFVICKYVVVSQCVFAVAHIHFLRIEIANSFHLFAGQSFLLLLVGRLCRTLS